MTPLSRHQLHPILLLLLLPSALCATFLLPVFKTTDHARPQYHTKLEIGTPPIPVTLTLDVNSPYTWLACDSVGYNRSSTYATVHCNTLDCAAYSGAESACIDCNETVKPSCNLNQCASMGSNPVSARAFIDPIVRDTATLYRLATPSSVPAKTTLQRLPITCANTATLMGLSQYTNGVLSLGRAPISLEYQLSAAFNVPKKFALCLPSSVGSTGALYLGGAPYFNDVAKAMVNVPLLVNGNSSINRFQLGDPYAMHYINVNGIEIDGSPVRFDPSLLTFNGSGDGGTVVSTIAPYGVLHSDIYKPFVELFVRKAVAMKVKMVRAARREFGACFDPKSIRYDPKTGSGLPVVELVLEGGGRWRILGSNLLVKVKGDAWCLAFVEAGARPRPWWKEASPAVVIGGAQMEDSWVEFDLEKSKLGITSALSRFGTSCSQLKSL